jgi:membrane protease YdiL (CAAX protease family)
MSASRVPLVDDHPVAAFVVGAYLYTWVVSAPAVVMEPGWTAAILIYVGSVGPPVAAGAVTYLRGDEVRAWARQILAWRRPLRWWVAAAGLPLGAAVVITAVLYAVGGPVDLSAASLSPVLFVVVFAIAMTVSGGLNEEPGWRGFAQARLNGRYGALPASLLIGVVWAGWHLPYFLAPVAPHSSFTLVNSVAWVGGIFTLTVVLAWIYNNTGSVLLAMVAHAMANTADMVIPLAADRLVVDGVVDESAVAVVSIVHLGVYAAIAAGLVAVYGWRTLAGGSMPTAADAGGRD